MFKKLLKEIEKRAPVETLSRFEVFFERDTAGHARLSEKAFSELLEFLEQGEASYQNLAVQAGVRWATVTQRVTLRNTILNRGFVTPACMWAYRQLRGNPEELLKEYPSPDMGFMQVVLLKECDPAVAIPFLIESVLSRRDVQEELRAASRLCILRLLDSGISPELLTSLRSRYGGVEILHLWRPSLPRNTELPNRPSPGQIDFHQLLRSVHDMKELSSLTRTVYLLSLFYVPLTDKEWRSLWLSHTDHLFFHRLRLAKIVEASNGGYLLTTEGSKQQLVKKFLFESYSFAKESVHRNRTERLKEERERRVRNSELDRQALEMVPDGIICVDRTGLLYYMNPAAESVLTENQHLRELLFGNGSLEDALRRYSRDHVLSRITAFIRKNQEACEIFGDRIIIYSGGKRFEVELQSQVILLKDTTDQYLIDKEIGSLYRHELKAALDVIGVGLDSAKELVSDGRIEEGVQFLDQVEHKRVELFAMLEDRMDFIRLHSDAFQIRPSTVNLNLVVDRCVANYREAAAGKGLTIKSDHLHQSACYVRGEERFLVRALDNIIRNAVKFTEKGGEITISTGGENLEAFVRVEDSGPGIPPENLGKIFQLGFTTGGTGRGLYLARRIATAHNGRIEVRSKPGSGSSFTIRLPLLTEPK
ncbi:MAG: HAMP domain-containing histidine kinase [Desulfomonile tiedjei]|uniref:histidine kinase n=1 Tax=Desulfomonile tiedjei TaxID=2358 RepID=A0A9D6V609_9BACT|nr:HAMP domain-containing histidine kinase [Desulfomonile tiedjei]